MNKIFKMKSLILFLVVIMAGFSFVGCDEMEDEDHNTEEGRTGTSGYSLIMTITPSRVPSNNDATMNIHVRFVDLSDLSPVANRRIRLAVESPYGYEMDPDIVSFSDRTFITDVVTDSQGNANATLYAGSLGRSVPEVVYAVDAQSTVEYEYENMIEVRATETFFIYNPFWDGTRPADTTLPTAVITFYPSTGITPGTTITFMGANSYDRGDEDLTFGKAYDEIVQYSWNFADGSYGSGKTQTHAYAGIGSYNVELLVVDDEGMTGQTTASVTVAENTPTPTP